MNFRLVIPYLLLILHDLSIIWYVDLVVLLVLQLNVIYDLTECEPDEWGFMGYFIIDPVVKHSTF